MAKKKYIDGGREMDSRLPKIPKLTKARLKEIDEQQAQMARHMGLQATPEQRKFARARARIEELQKIPREDWNEKQLQRYVEALDATGKFNEAYELTGDEKYQQLWQSIWLDDKAVCACPDTSDVVLQNGRQVPVMHSRHFVRRRVYSLKHDAWVDVKVCNVCGHVNSKPDEKIITQPE